MQEKTSQQKYFGILEAAWATPELIDSRGTECCFDLRDIAQERSICFYVKAKHAERSFSKHEMQEKTSQQTYMYFWELWQLQFIDSLLRVLEKEMLGPMYV